MYVQIDFENDSSLIMEGVGPNSIIGIVSDAVFGHYTESPDGKKVQSIVIGHNYEHRSSGQVS